MTTKPTFKICRCCGTAHGLTARVCKSCGVKPIWDRPTDEQIAKAAAKRAEIDATFQELLAKAEG